MFSYCVLLLSSATLIVEGFDVYLRCDGPVVLGGTINFWAEIKGAFYEDFKYDWSDNAKSRHSGEFIGKTSANMSITYRRDESLPGTYQLELNACERNIFNYWPCEKRILAYDVTDDLNGNLQILQNNTVKQQPFVSNQTEVEHKVSLKQTDLNVLKEHNFTVISFWLINCTYLGMTNDLTFSYNYTTADEDFTVKAIVVAAKLNETTNVTEVFPETSWPNGTLKVLNATLTKGKHLTIVHSSLNTTNATVKAQNATSEQERAQNATVGTAKTQNSTNGEEKVPPVTEKTHILLSSLGKENMLNIPLKKDSYFTPWPDGSCNGSFIPKDPDKLYGYFHHDVKPRRPVEISHVVGNNWLENGDLLNLTVTFTGSPPYDHCIQFIPGEYKKNGNESCNNTQKTTSNKINIVHYYGSGDKHTVLFIIGNVVSKTVTAVVVTNYKAKTHPQLSVVIVPVIFIGIAIISIVFGVAYYIQSINRGPIEVADFDFSANNDTEYKSFKGRLVEALSSAFTRSNLDEEFEEGHSWSPSRNGTNRPQMFSNPFESD